jgi:hypothetical protein
MTSSAEMSTSLSSSPSEDSECRMSSAIFQTFNHTGQIFLMSKLSLINDDTIDTDKNILTPYLKNIIL